MKIGIPFVFVIVLVLFGVGLMFAKSKDSSKKTTNSELSQNVIPSVTVSPTPEQVSTQNNLPLTITTPSDKSTVTTSSLPVKGKTGAKAQVAVNDIDTTADANGNFSATVTLDEGENTIFIVVNDATGNVTEKELTITYESGN